MNLIITVIEPPQMDIYKKILNKLDLRLNMAIRGRGTASKRLLDRLGLEDKPKYAVVSTAGEENTKKLMQLVRRELYIDAPGNGISIAVPIKSVGGAKTLDFLKGNEPSYETEQRASYDTELILTVANEGFSEQIMDAARAAGARGGTILLAKGTADKLSDKFYNLTLSDEKEIIMIVAPTADKNAIMNAIIKSSGRTTEAGAITFSLPISEAMGVSTATEEN